MEDSWSERVAGEGLAAVLRVFSSGGNAGSGFFIHPSGLAVTNDHVVVAGDGGSVQLADPDLSGMVAPFEVIARGPSRDLALLRVSLPVEVSALELGSSRGLPLGSPVLAVGAPQGMFPVVTTGVLSGRSQPGSIAELLVPEQLIHAAPTLRGSSGCPILGVDGHVVGVQSAKPSMELVKVGEPVDEAGELFDRDLGRYRFQTETFGLAVPVEDLRQFMPAWIAPEWTTGLETGFSCDPFAAAAWVEEVSAGSPAARAGLLPGDQILEFGGREVLSVVDLAVWLSEPSAVRVLVGRGGTTAELSFERSRWSRPAWDDLDEGLSWREALGMHSRLPRFEHEEVVASGTAPSVQLPTSHRGREGFVLEMRGWVDVPDSGRWNFELSSDDGSQLYLRDRLVVDGDGLHGHRPARGVIELEAGPQPIRVLFFEAGGEESLELRWGLEGEALEPLPASHLRHAGGGGW